MAPVDDSDAPALLALAPEVMATYVAGLRARDAARDREDAAHRHRVRGRLPEAVRYLVETCGATEVILFGSLARGTATTTSDVDLLVSSVGPLRLLDAAGSVSRILGAEPDLVAREAVRPEVAARIAAEGEVLHG